MDIKSKLQSKQSKIETWEKTFKQKCQENDLLEKKCNDTTKKIQVLKKVKQAKLYTHV